MLAGFIDLINGFYHWRMSVSQLADVLLCKKSGYSCKSVNHKEFMRKIFDIRIPRENKIRYQPVDRDADCTQNHWCNASGEI